MVDVRLMWGRCRVDRVVVVLEGKILKNEEEEKEEVDLLTTLKLVCGNLKCSVTLVNFLATYLETFLLQKKWPTKYSVKLYFSNHLLQRKSVEA